ncbi:MAG: DUF6064 family protein [Hyphomicrobiaceae bacterium]
MFNNYTIGDMLLFSSETYVRLFELYNADVWPLHILALALTSGLLAAIWFRSRITDHLARLSYVVLALCWLWVAYAFHLERYASINWAAKGFAALFAAEGFLLLAVARFGQPSSLFGSVKNSARVGHGLFLVGVIAVPIISIFASDSWRSGQMFALTPDPTAIATLGILLFASGRRKYALMAIPLVWCAVSVATHWAMVLQ